MIKSHKHIVCVCVWEGIRVHHSSLYVSRFSSDTRCRDPKIKSQSVCHLLTPFPHPHLVLLSLFSHHLSSHLLRNLLVPYWLFAKSNQFSGCTVCWIITEAPLNDAKIFHAHAPNKLTVSGKVPLHVRCVLEPLNRDAEVQIIKQKDRPGGLRRQVTRHYWLGTKCAH